MYYGNDEELKALLERSIELPEMGEYGYDWCRFASFYDPVTRMFYWVRGSGCSCNDLWDDIETVGDLNVGRKEELLRAAEDFGSDYYKEHFEPLRRAVSNIES